MFRLVVFPALVLGTFVTNFVHAAPKIDNLSIRGLRTGDATSLVIEGGDLFPGTEILLPFPLTSQKIKEGASPKRVEIEIQLGKETSPGIYPLRIVNDRGISNAVLVAVDSLAQRPAAELAGELPVALYGQLQGNEVVSTKFQGTKGQRIVIEVDARRLGSALDPIVELLDERRVQVAWSQGLVRLAGDARLETTLPADGVYFVELHDALYRGPQPGYFRLKIGDLLAADFVYPLGLTRGMKGSVELIGDLPNATAVEVDLAQNAGDLPARLPPMDGVTGAAPRVLSSDFPQYVERPLEKFQIHQVTPPSVINGRLDQPRQVDHFKINAPSGSKLRIDVIANRIGSPLDGVLEIQDMAGKPLAKGDDRPGTIDPGLDFTVPEGRNEFLLAISDLQTRGGADYVYQVTISPADRPDFTLSLFQDRHLVPLAGNALIRVRANRVGYGGPIRLTLNNMIAGVDVQTLEIPAGASDALVSLAGFGLSPKQGILHVTGESVDPNVKLQRAALLPENVPSSVQPWLRGDVGIALTGPGPINVRWRTSAPFLPTGNYIPATVEITRGPKAKGAVRLSMLTSQVVPRTQDNNAEDVNRAIRLEGTPTLGAGDSIAMVNILVPGDLPLLPYDLAIKAELLSDGDQKVIGTAVSAATRILAQQPMRIELTSAPNVEAKSGGGQTGSLVGKIARLGEIGGPVIVTLVGLPAEIPAPVAEFPPGAAEFSLPVSFPFGTPAGDLQNVRLVALSGTDPDRPVRSGEVPVAIKVVAGDAPPAAPPLHRIFEDERYFAGFLHEGDGQARVETNDRYSGAAALRVTNPQKYRTKMPEWGFKITEKPGENQFRYLRFAWKKKGGSNILLQLGVNGGFGPARGMPGPAFRYEAGSPNPFNVSAVSLDSKIPEEWVVVTRDLFADFGEFSLDGIAFTVGEGEYGLFDHIYLARSVADLKDCLPPVQQQKPVATTQP